MERTSTNNKHYISVDQSWLETCYEYLIRIHQFPIAGRRKPKRKPQFLVNRFSWQRSFVVFC